MNDVDVKLIPSRRQRLSNYAVMAALGEDPGALSALIRFTAPIDMSEHPELTLTGGFGTRETPIAFQLIGRYFSEHLLQRTGRAY